MDKLTAVWLAVVACGGSSGAKPDAVAPDAPSDAYTPGPNAVTLHLGAAPTLIAYRDGKGPWLAPQKIALGQYELDVTDDYQYVVVCANGSSFETVIHGGTYGDGATQYGFCFADSAATVAVTGQMVQPGTVAMYDSASSATGNWAFDLSMPTGIHDLTATGASKMLIRRDLSITSATTLPTVDLAASGTAYTSVPLTINNLGTDALSTELDLLLAHDAAALLGSSATLDAPPAALLLPGDQQFLDVSASTGTTVRSADTAFTGTETMFTLPPALTGVTYSQVNGVLSASWGTLPPFTELALDLTGGTGSTHQRIEGSKSWLQATGATELIFDVAPPGYQAAWVVDLAGPYKRQVLASEITDTISYSTASFEEVGTSTREPPSRTRELMQRLERAAR